MEVGRPTLVVSGSIFLVLHRCGTTSFNEITDFGHIASNLKVYPCKCTLSLSNKMEGYHVDHVPYQEPRPANPGVGVSNLVIPAYQAPYPPPSIDFLIISLGVFYLPSSQVTLSANSYSDY
jgi:hypothetical protein